MNLKLGKKNENVIAIENVKLKPRKNFCEPRRSEKFV